MSRPITATYPSRAKWADAGLLPVTTASAHFDRCVRGGPDALAVVEGKVRLSYRDLDRAVARAAAGLAEVGVAAGDVVTMELPNWWEAVVVFHAVTRLGAVINPVVPIYRDRELGFILRQATPAAVVVPQRFRGYDYVAMLQRLGAGGGPDGGGQGGGAGFPPVVVARPESSLPAGFVALDDLGAGTGGPGATTADAPKGAKGAKGDIPGAGRTRAGAGPGAGAGDAGAADDISLLLYTSGTTADPKGVLHSHQTLGYEVQSFIDMFDLGPDDVAFMPSPLTHITGFLFGLLLPVMTGTAVALLDIWEPRAAVELIEAERCRFTMGATPFLHGLVEEYAGRGGRSALRAFLCGGADVPPALVRRAHEVLGCHVARVYGSTEFPTLSCGQPGNSLELCAETDGLPIGPVECRLESVAGGIGELAVDGPERFLGYLDPGLNAAAFTDDGYFLTGDLATIDDDGAVTIRGRSKDIIIRGGENISAKEVEDLLYSHPLVDQVAIVAMPDQVLVERACAFVVPAAGAAGLTLGALSEYLDAQGLAKQKFPERLELVDALPVTASGKVQKYLLRDRIREILNRSEQS